RFLLCVQAHGEVEPPNDQYSDRRRKRPVDCKSRDQILPNSPTAQRGGGSPQRSALGGLNDSYWGLTFLTSWSLQRFGQPLRETMFLHDRPRIGIARSITSDRNFIFGFSVSLIRPDSLHFVLDRTIPIGSWCRVFHEYVQHTPSGFCPWWRRDQFFAQPNRPTVRTPMPESQESLS